MCLSPEQIDQLSEEEKRTLIQHLITKVSVFFVAETSRHRLDVEFTEAVSQALQVTSDPQAMPEDTEEAIEGTSGESSADLGRHLKGDAGKNALGNLENLYLTPINLH